MPDDISLEPVWLSLELAAVTTVVLLILAAPLAWWLARTKSAWRAPVGAVVTLPLVLPPSVLGFYILVALGPPGPLGQLTQSMGLGLLTFPCRLRLKRSVSAPRKWPQRLEPNRLTPFFPWCFRGGAPAYSRLWCAPLPTRSVSSAGCS